VVDSRDDEITELKIKLSDALDHQEKQKVECDSLQKQLDKMLDQWRNFKEEANQKYEQYSKQINQAEMKNEEHNRSLIHECEKQREEVEAMRNERQNAKIEMHELQVKLDGYMRDYDRYFVENKRLRELVNTIRDEKDTAISELNRLKVIYHDRVNELNDECNIKLAQVENQLLEQKEKHRHTEEGAYEVMAQQEKIVDKWKAEHRQTCTFYEKTTKQLEVENRMLKDKVIKLKSTVSVLREGRLPPEGPDGGLQVRKEKSRGREEPEVSKDKKDKKKK
jgi:chromosome segregation ATPase